MSTWGKRSVVPLRTSAMAVRFARRIAECGGGLLGVADVPHSKTEFQLVKFRRYQWCSWLPRGPPIE